MDGLDAWDAETVGEALDVLQDLVLWELTPQRWAQVEGLVDRIGHTHAAGDFGGLRAAVTDLERNGPMRALRIGSAGEQGIPDRVLDRRNALVHTLSRERREASRGRLP